MKKTLYRAALCGCLTLGVTTGCAEEPAEAARATSHAPVVVQQAPYSPDVKVGRVRAPTVDAAATIRAQARWLPAGATILMTADARSSADLVNFWSVAGDSPRANKIRARFDAMLGELGELSDERLGMNPLGTRAIVAGLDTESVQGTMIVLGATVAAADVVKMNGFDTFKIVPRHPADAEQLEELAELPAADQPWALKLPDGSGVVLSTRGILEKLTADESATLAKSDALEVYTSALTGGPTHFSMAMNRAFFETVAEPRSDDEFLDIDFAVLMMDEQLTTVRLRARDEKLGELEASYEKAVADGTAKMKKRYDARNEKNTAEAAAFVLGYHGALALDESVKMTREPGKLTVVVHNSALSTLSSLSSLLDLADELEDDDSDD